MGEKMDVLQIAKDLINTKFYQGMDNTELVNLLCSYFSEAKEIVTIKDRNGLTNLLIGLNCNLENLDDAIMLSGHMDTVKPGEGWETDSLIDGDKLYGLGSTDMKSFFASVIINLHELKNLDVPIFLGITADEETFGEGIKVLTDEMKKRNINPKYALIGEPTENTVITSNRGNYVYIISLTGKECHSMKPENGINALYAASHVINHIEQLSEYYSDCASLNPIIVEGGKMPNQICGNCLMKLSIRTASLEVHDKIKESIDTKLEEIAERYKLPNFVFEKVFELSAFEKRDSDINNMLCNFLNSDEGEYLACTEAGELQKYGIPNISIIGPGNLNLAHKQNEYCSVSQLKYYSEKLPDMLKEASKKLETPKNVEGGVKR